ncbi:hypothetical protein [Absidia glauca]|uniref:SUN-like protein 1 n=1 Tax=Absidia glauca TaxID=4829 RepID=A0A168SXU2_ABSGL|nr:hypothetical protein [Absidia glauca]
MHNTDPNDTPPAGHQQQQQHSDYNGQPSKQDASSPPASSTHMSVHNHSPTSHPTSTRPPSSHNNNNGNDRRVTIPSFEEWKKRIRQTEETDDTPRPKRKSTRGAANQGRETIDSVDGGFSDDVGSVFDSSDPNGPVSTSENTYEEGEYIAPQKQQQRRSSNKKHFAQVPLKSLKERFNYAWTICAATVRDVNKEARGAQSILFESKDQYLLNKCSADKFVIINLCEEILIDTIVLANFEFFSSTFKDFRVYVANTYPTKDWQLLGQWQAKNTRDLQVFKVQDSIGWFEYIKIEFLTHYGHEYYCPLSLVRVHGMPMMEYYNAVESQGLSGDGDTETLGDQHLWPADLRDDIIHPQLVTNTSEWFPSKGDDTMDQLDDDDDDDDGENVGHLPGSILPEGTDYQSANTTNLTTNHDGDQQVSDPTLTTTLHQSHSNTDPQPASDSAISPPPVLTPVEPEEPTKSSDIDHATSPATSPTTTTDILPIMDQNQDILDGTSQIMDSITASDNTTSTTDSYIDQQPTNNNTDAPVTTDPVDASVITTTATTNSNESPNRPSSDATMTQPDIPLNTPKPTPDISTSAPIDPTSSEAPSPSITGDETRPKIIPNSHSKEPATQESIYKIIMKRLNALEANATLSQRYLDEQNNMLNDVFTEMERRHQDQLILVLDRLNETASSRIDSMKRRYEQSYGELKQQMETDMREMTAKISILTDQISFEKRVSMAQLAIVVTLFVFLALSRGTMSTLSPVMMAQAEERKRRQSDATRSADKRTSQRDSPASTLTALTKRRLDPSTKIKLGMDGRKAASLEALKLHLAQQADLLPKLPSQQQQQERVPSSSSSSSIDANDKHHQEQQVPRNGRSISLNDITTTSTDDPNDDKAAVKTEVAIDTPVVAPTIDDDTSIDHSKKDDTVKNEPLDSLDIQPADPSLDTQPPQNLTDKPPPTDDA